MKLEKRKTTKSLENRVESFLKRRKLTKDYVNEKFEEANYLAQKLKSDSAKNSQDVEEINE